MSSPFHRPDGGPDVDQWGETEHNLLSPPRRRSGTATTGTDAKGSPVHTLRTGETARGSVTVMMSRHHASHCLNSRDHYGQHGK
jgi:hypothetical protein